MLRLTLFIRWNRGRDLRSHLQHENDSFNLKSNRKEDLSRPPIVVDGKVLNTKSIDAQTLVIHQQLKPPSPDSANQSGSPLQVAEDFWNSSAIARAFTAEPATSRRDWTIRLTAPDDVHSLRSAEVSLEYFSFVIPPDDNNSAASSPASRCASSVSYAMNSITAPTSASQMTLSPVDLPIHYADDQKAAKEAKKKKVKLSTDAPALRSGSSEFMRSMQFMRKTDADDMKAAPAELCDLNDTIAIKKSPEKKDLLEKKEIREKKVVAKKHNLLHGQPRRTVVDNVERMKPKYFDQNTSADNHKHNVDTINSTSIGLSEDIKIFNKMIIKKRLDSLHPSKSPHRRYCKNVVSVPKNILKGDNIVHLTSNDSIAEDSQIIIRHRKRLDSLHPSKSPHRRYSKKKTNNLNKPISKTKSSDSIINSENQDTIESNENIELINLMKSRNRTDSLHPLRSQHQRYKYQDNKEFVEKKHNNDNKVVKRNTKLRFDKNQSDYNDSINSPEEEISNIINEFIDKQQKVNKTNSTKYKWRKKPCIGNKCTKTRNASLSPLRIQQPYEHSTTASRNKSADTRMVYSPKPRKRFISTNETYERIPEQRRLNYRSKKNRVQFDSNISVETISESEMSNGEYETLPAVTKHASKYPTVTDLENTDVEDSKLVVENKKSPMFVEGAADVNYLSSFHSVSPAVETQVLTPRVQRECMFDSPVEIAYKYSVPSLAKHLYSYAAKSKIDRVSSFEHELHNGISSTLGDNQFYYKQPIVENAANLTESMYCERANYSEQMLPDPVSKQSTVYDDANSKESLLLPSGRRCNQSENVCKPSVDKARRADDENVEFYGSAGILDAELPKKASRVFCDKAKSNNSVINEYGDNAINGGRCSYEDAVNSIGKNLSSRLTLVENEVVAKTAGLLFEAKPPDLRSNHFTSPNMPTAPPKPCKRHRIVTAAAVSSVSDTESTEEGDPIVESARPNRLREMKPILKKQTFDIRLCNICREQLVRETRDNASSKGSRRRSGRSRRRRSRRISATRKRGCRCRGYSTSSRGKSHPRRRRCSAKSPRRSRRTSSNHSSTSGRRTSRQRNVETRETMQTERKSTQQSSSSAAALEHIVKLDIGDFAERLGRTIHELRSATKSRNGNAIPSAARTNGELSNAPRTADAFAYYESFDCPLDLPDYYDSEATVVGEFVCSPFDDYKLSSFKELDFNNSNNSLGQQNIRESPSHRHSGKGIDSINFGSNRGNNKTYDVSTTIVEDFAPSDSEYSQDSEEKRTDDVRDKIVWEYNFRSRGVGNIAKPSPVSEYAFNAAWSDVSTEESGLQTYYPEATEWDLHTANIPVKDIMLHLPKPCSKSFEADLAISECVIASRDVDRVDAMFKMEML